MTDAYVQTKLTELFLSEGEKYIQDNVALPNKIFVAPKDKRYFKVSFVVNAPESASMGSEADNRWNGIFQIDIFTPLDKGEDEANTKYEALSEIFYRGRFYCGIDITKCYRASPIVEADCYRLPVRIEWTADLRKL